MSRKKVADILFPHVHDTIEDLRKKYPVRREGQIISRFAPSPTGFLHVGSLRTAFIAWKIASQEEDGVFILRIEDTDQKRIVDDAIDHIISSLKTFDISAHEGPLGPDNADI
ncbi:MAG: hypothetical protein GXP45_08105 [bacterium]|nr:hypothetical protein [bacterium]